ncbi:MAG: hypothetical protein ACYDCI_05620 [Candidatus Limnocylindrales bacterium]
MTRRLDSPAAPTILATVIAVGVVGLHGDHPRDVPHPDHLLESGQRAVTLVRPVQFAAVSNAVLRPAIGRLLETRIRYASGTVEVDVPDGTPDWRSGAGGVTRADQQGTRRAH